MINPGQKQTFRSFIHLYSTLLTSVLFVKRHGHCNGQRVLLALILVQDVSGKKKAPTKFSVENSMVPGQVPEQLQNLTQVEEMLIARALPIMRVYIKPGGHRGYSGHCINLPQNITEIASALSRYPKDISVIVVKVIGKNNTFKDVNVRRHKVDSAFLWLIQNNPHYNDVKVDNSALCSLPENGVPFDISTVDADSDILSDEIPHPDQRPLNEENVVYNKSTEMSSFLPVGRQ